MGEKKIKVELGRLDWGFVTMYLEDAYKLMPESDKVRHILKDVCAEIDRQLERS